MIFRSCKGKKKDSDNERCGSFIVAEKVRFELTIPLRVCRFSRAVPSTTWLLLLYESLESLLMFYVAGLYVFEISHNFFVSAEKDRVLIF